MSSAEVPSTEITGPTTTHMWRPWTLRTRCLAGFTILCLLLLIGNIAVILGCVGGCHVFGNSSDGRLPPQSRFAYNLLPTILSVGLSFLWVVPHHDIIRLEPFFRMSTENGEKATTSLFLQYPYEIALFVPVKALLNRHYVVAISASILFLMSSLVVPLLPNIFDTSLVVARLPGNTMQTIYDNVGRNVSANTAFSAYDYAWLSGSLPPFMTETYTLLPLFPDGYTFPTAENWTVETTLFEGELQCADAQQPAIGYVNNSLTVNITSADQRYVVRLCDAGALEQGRAVPNDDCDAHTAFITPWTSISWQLGNTANPPVSYMYAWASGPPSPPNITDNSTFPPPTDITAIFCTPMYYSETVNATISMPSGEVLNITRSGKRTKMPSLRGFDGILDGNIETNFTNELLVKGVPDLHQVPVRFGYPPESLPSVSTDLLTRFGESSRPIQAQQLMRASTSNVFMTRTDSLSAFSMFGHTNETLGELLNGLALENTNERGLKMLFAFAMSEMLGNYPNNKGQAAVERETPAISITVNRNWAWAGIAGLTVTTSLAALLVILIRKRPCKLDGEPDSLAASLRLLAASPGMCAAMEWAEYYKPKALSRAMDDKNLFFRLGLVDGKGPAIRVMRGTGRDAEEAPHAPLFLDPGPGAKVQEEKPWALKNILRVTCLGCFPIVLVLLIVSFVNSGVQDGFALPGGPNTFHAKVLYTYFPTILGIIIEPILTTLSITYCMMGPYTALETSEARYSKSLAVDYGKLPPQLQLQTSLKNREFTLLALSMVILLSNCLPITTVGLFYPSPYIPKVPRPHNVLHNFTSVRQEMYFQLDKNLTSGYSPTWTTQDFYIDPPYELAPNGEGVYDTTGFGIDISCTVIPDNRITFPCSPQYNNNITSDVCTKYGPRDNFLALENACGTTDLSLSFWDGTCLDTIMISNTCADRIFPVWAENEKYAVDPPGPTDSYRFAALNCSLVDRIAGLRITVKDGQVLSVTDVRPLSTVEVASLYPANTSAAVSLSRSFVSVLRKDMRHQAAVLGNHPIARINNLMATLSPDVVREPRNETHVPDGRAAVGAFEVVLRGLYVILLRMSAEDIFGVGFEQGAEYGEAYRVHVDEVNFAVTMLIVLLSCVVIVALYVRRERKVTGHLPYTLAGIYSHLYMSNVQEEMEEVGGDLKLVKKESKRLQRRYAYGKHPDGRHYGVYRVQTEAQVGLLTEAEPKDQGVSVETVPV